LVIEIDFILEYTNPSILVVGSIKRDFTKLTFETSLLPTATNKLVTYLSEIGITKNFTNIYYVYFGLTEELDPLLALNQDDINLISNTLNKTKIDNQKASPKEILIITMKELFKYFTDTEKKQACHHKLAQLLDIKEELIVYNKKAIENKMDMYKAKAYVLEDLLEGVISNK